MLSSTRQFTDAMDNKGIKYEYKGTTDSGKDIVVLSYTCENIRFRFVKCVIDTNDHTVQAEADVAFRSHDVGDICLEYVSRCINICDDAYPELMKALWG